MTIKKLLISNRGEIAIRIIRAASEVGMETVAIYSEDDARSLHVSKADTAHALVGKGARAYLDIEQIVAAAQSNGCDSIHPGYGFLAENAALAEACDQAGLTFVGPTADTLALFGDKVRARALAAELDIPLLPGTNEATTLEQARDFFSALASGRSMMIKAIAGGGGRGMRVVHAEDELEAAYAACQREGEMSFGSPDVFVEQFLPRARHVEVQIIGDGEQVSHVFERECSLQRRNQKLVEIAPSPTLPAVMKESLHAAAVKMASAGQYRSLGTFEFLVDAENPETDFAFMEANARLQVEHTVTEEITGIDLVASQLKLAGGASLKDLGLDQAALPTPRGHAIQMRVNMERIGEDGKTRPSGGTLSVFEPPTGPGVRVDTFGYAGYKVSHSFDSLLAKLIVSATSSDYADVLRRAYRALCEFRIEGVETNRDFLKTLIQRPEVAANDVYTRFVEDNVGDLASPSEHQELYFGSDTEDSEKQSASADADAARSSSSTSTSSSTSSSSTSSPALAGVKVSDDPLAVLDHGRGGGGAVSAAPATLELVTEELPEGVDVIRAPMQGTVISFDVSVGDSVHVGQQVLVLEAMKMEHVVHAGVSGHVQRLGVTPGDAVFEDHPLIYLEVADVEAAQEAQAGEQDLDYIRPDLQEAIDRHAAGLDENRPEAVAKRRGRGNRTARENLAELVDEGTFVEYGPTVLAAQRRRRSVEDLIENTTGDGMVGGLGQVNGEQFSEDRARCMVMSYDYMVLAGTQGQQNHRKKDRLFEIAAQNRLPTVVFAEGGGGRPGDTDGGGAVGLQVMAFTLFAQLSGLVPIVGITNGRCFAGNAVLLACCDVIIATEDSNIGIGGPAMIEGGGLGVFKPEEVGPMDIQVPNGVVDIPVKDEEEAVAVAKKYLSYFQGTLSDWEAPDQRKLRYIVPENRLRYYDIREVIDTIADIDSVLEIRRHWGDGIVTSFIRVEGRPVGVVANNPGHLSGAIDSDGADKATRFVQLCDAFDIPLLFLCDCPGIMVGPESEKTALVRHAARLFVTAANISVPFFTIIIRKSYGLGAQAMAGGSFSAPTFVVSWPTGEFGGMGLEGAVKLGYRKELEAISDPAERKAAYDQMVEDSYRRGKAVNTASLFEVDDVIDPAESRRWILTALRSAPPVPQRDGKKRPNVDTW